MSTSQRSWNRIGFAVLGLANNFGYVIMLSAAHDLLSSNAPPPPSNATMISSNSTTTIKPYCNPHSTSTILLADTLPSLIIKILYPFLLVNESTPLKVLATVLSAMLSYLITGFSKTELVVFIGVIFASISSGIGESTFLSSTPKYGTESLSGWSIGTGMAGILGALSYTILAAHFKTTTIMFMMIVVPLGMGLAYFYLITPMIMVNEETSVIEAAATPTNSSTSDTAKVNETSLLTTDSNDQIKYMDEGPVQIVPEPASDPPRVVHLESEPNKQEDRLTPSESINLLPSLAKYFLPLAIVYFAEYFINQGLTELIFFPEINYLTHSEQYRWFQVVYQLGVLFSRSSIEFFRIKYLWILAFLQMTNVVIFLTHTTKIIHVPNFYLVLIIILYEGFLGGFAYVNTFYRVTKELRPRERVFGMSAVTNADSFGIVIAGFTSIPVHERICKLYQ